MSARADSLPTWPRFGGITGTRTALARHGRAGYRCQTLQAWARQAQEWLIQAHDHAEAVRADLRRAVDRLAAVASPGVYICDRCIALAGGVAGSDSAARTLPGPVRAVPEQVGGTRYLSLCNEILAEELA